MKTVKLETMQEYENRTGKKYNSLIVAANNVRTELKAAFPGVKFSVRTSRFAGGNDLRVEWVDGPTEKQVEEIINKYAAGHFDGMIDLYEYNHDEFNTLYGSAKFVSTTRNLSETFASKIAEIVILEYGKNVDVKFYNNSKNVYFDSEEYAEGSYNDYHWRMDCVARRKADETSETDLAAAIQKVLDERFEAIVADDETAIELGEIELFPANNDIEIEEVKDEPFDLFSWGMNQFQAVYELVS